MALSTAKEPIVSASWDRTVRVWDTGTGEGVQRLEGHTNMVNSAGVSSDGRVAVSGVWDKVIQLWDTVGGQCLRSRRTHGSRDVGGHQPRRPAGRVGELGQDGACLGSAELYGLVQPAASVG